MSGAVKTVTKAVGAVVGGGGSHTSSGPAAPVFTHDVNTSLLTKYGMTDAASRQQGAGDQFVATLPAWEQANYIADRRAAGDTNYVIPASAGQNVQQSQSVIYANPIAGAPSLTDPNVQKAGADQAGVDASLSPKMKTILTDEDIAAEKQDDATKNQKSLLGA